MKVFLVFTVPTPDEFGDYFPFQLHHTPGSTFVVIDNDSSPELEPNLRSIAGTLNDSDSAKVHRISRTPMWKIIEDIFTGQAAAGITEPLLVAAANDPRIAQPIEISGLLGPAGDVTESFVFSENPVEMMATLVAKTKKWQGQSVFAPGAYVPSRVESESVRLVPPLGNLATLFGADKEAVNEGAANVFPPPAVHGWLVKFYEAQLGPEAAHFLVRLQTASQIADDFVDGDVRWWNRPDAMREMLEILLLEIPHDPFYLANQKSLEEVIAQCISVWTLSNGIVLDTTPESRMWCYIQREAFQMVVWRVAVIVGGLDHGRNVLLEMQQILHGPRGGAKKFPEWLEETRARVGRG